MMAAIPLTLFVLEKRRMTLFLFLHFCVTCCQEKPQLLPTDQDHERNIVSENSRQTSTDASTDNERITVTDELPIVTDEATTADMSGHWYTLPTQSSFLPITNDDALKSQRTTEFLKSIHDLEIRTLTEKYLSHCPMNPLCNFSLGYSYKPQGDPCCAPCNCTASCEIGENCCPHLLPELGPLVPTAEDRGRCIDPVVLRRISFLGHREGYRMETTCSGLTGDSRLPYLCSAPYEKRVESLKVSDVVPVTDLASNTTYLNIHCARCVGLKLDSVSFWQPEIQCSNGPLLVSPKASVIEAIRAKGDCYLKNIPGAELQDHLSYCIASYRDTCNETGLWKQYDKFTERACTGFTSNYTIETRDGYIVYRNVFCAICNGETITEACNLIFPESTISLVPFSALLQFNLNDVEIAEGLSSVSERDSPSEESNRNDCEINFLYDTHKVWIVEHSST